MLLWGVPINSSVAFVIQIALGLAIDYNAIITHAFISKSVLSINGILNRHVRGSQPTGQKVKSFPSGSRVGREKGWEPLVCARVLITVP